MRLLNIHGRIEEKRIYLSGCIPSGRVKGLIVEHLSLTNFRNYASLELELPPNIMVLQGDNAQGKSNLLEAIYLLATSRSPRATNDHLPAR